MRNIRSYGIIRPRLNEAGKRIHHRSDEPRGVRDFVGIDGEGITINGEHRYVLLGLYNKDGSIGDKLVNNEGISWQEAFEFIYEHYRKGLAFCGFFLSYDFNQLFKTLPQERAAMLLTKEGRAKRQRKGKNPAPWPVECDGWEFDLLGMKRLKIRPKACEHLRQKGRRICKCKTNPWLYINDTGPFFQQSFLRVINPKSWKEPVVSDEEYAKIERGKAHRSDAGVVDADMVEYNRLENQVLCRVLGELDKGFREIGVCLPPSKWFGPGQAAQAWLISNAVKKTKELESVIPDWFFDAARKSYFGGWFEIMMHGILPGDTWEYDINSAYPYIISQLPCLEHGTYSRGEGYPENVGEKDLVLVRARVWTRSAVSHHPASSKCHIGAMLHRDRDGNISRPTVTEGWFWWHELEAAKRAKLVQPIPRKPRNELHPICHEWVKYTPCDCFPPMRRIISLYLRRQAVGKDTPLGKGAKTSYNSMYGKFAQSVGSPIFGNPIYASLITAGCRAMICDAIASHPRGKSDVSMVATDAVYFRSRHPYLTTGEGLGEWGEKHRRNICQFKPGVYWDDASRAAANNGQSADFKARGISAADFASQLQRIDGLFREWDRNPIGEDNSPNWPKVSFQTGFSVVTCTQALEWDAWEKAGSVGPKLSIQSSDPSLKRTGLYWDGELFRSEPHTPTLVLNLNELTSHWEVESTPYEKRFGLNDPFSWESKESLGVSPEGRISDLIAFAFKAVNE